MVQVLFLILVFLMAILLHYLLSVSEHFSQQSIDAVCVGLPPELSGPNDPRLNTPELKKQYEVCQIERSKESGSAPVVALTAGATPVVAATQPAAVAATQPAAVATTQPAAVAATQPAAVAATQPAAVVAGQPSNPFRNLVNTLGLYVSAQDNPALTNPPNAPVAANTDLDDIRNLVEDEVALQLREVKLGPKDRQNTALANRNTAAISAGGHQANSDGLVQGQDYRTDPSCPYASSQMQPTAEPYPIDMNDYIRKDSIPCWSCNIK